MIPENYNAICTKILSETAKYIDTSRMKSFHINKENIQSDDAVYKSAVADRAPMTFVYTQAGAGKSSLIKDRAKALIDAGVAPEKIMVLNMNISKTNQMKKELPQKINAMTFSEFTHNIFMAQFPSSEFKVVDTNSVINMLKLTDNKIDPLKQRLVSYMSQKDPQEKSVLLTLFINQYCKQIIKMLSEIKMTDYVLESIICQNMIYSFKNNPYNLDAILINGVHNMPIHSLCAVLAYVNKYHCNLFMTGSPDETIYDFSMAYKNSMNVLSAYRYPVPASIIHLRNTKMSESISNVLEMKPCSSLNNIETTKIISEQKPEQMYDVFKKVLSPETTSFISSRLFEKKPILIVTRSAADTKIINQVLENEYRKMYPDMIIQNIAGDKPVETLYGRTLVDNLDYLENKYKTGVSYAQINEELHNMLIETLKQTESADCKYSLEHLPEFIKSIPTSSTPVSVKEIIASIIDKESDKFMEYINGVSKKSSLDFSGIDIIISTIHGSIDIRNDDVIVILKNRRPDVNKELYRVALSRANKSEYLVFINAYNFETDYQKYIKYKQTTETKR